MRLFFIHLKRFYSKNCGKDVVILDCCDDEGNLFQFFPDVSMPLPPLTLFQPILCETQVVPYGNNVRLRLISVKEV